MKRDYESGTLSTPTMFTGVEVEKTPALGMKTRKRKNRSDIFIIRSRK